MRITILNCYAPNSDSRNYFAQNFAQSGILENDSCIIGGDFNTILTSQDMRGAVINQHLKTTDTLLELMQHYELVDIWRIRNDNKFMYTWMRNNLPIYKQLDYILVSSHLQQDVVRTGIDPAFSYDHSIPWIQIDQSHVARQGKGYWKFNTSLLEDNDYISLVHNILDEIDNESYINPVLKWEIIKLKVRQHKLKVTIEKQVTDSLFSMQNSNRQIQRLKQEIDHLIHL